MLLIRQKSFVDRTPPDSLEELTALPQIPIAGLWGEGNGRRDGKAGGEGRGTGKRGGKKEGRERKRERRAMDGYPPESKSWLRPRITTKVISRFHRNLVL